MNINDPNVALVELAVHKLGNLVDRFVLVGGCAAGLLITDSARPPVRSTQDVDLIVEVTTLVNYYELTDQLKKFGFTENSEVICRWEIDSLKVDVMPTDETILGFSNKWYSEVVTQAKRISLPSSREVNLISPPLFIATKLEAFYGRGNGDYGHSHDIEDIVNVIDGRQELILEIDQAGEHLKKYLAEEIDDLLAIPDFVDKLSWHLHGDINSQSRVPYVISQLRSIAGL
jgi:predicted nucleotidyltransferase